MIRVGLTGGIGSGKSIICKVFNVLNVPVFNADIEAKKCYLLPVVIRKIVETFGERILTKKTIDNKKLADIVFGNPEALQKLNGIIHPMVMENYYQWSDAQRDYQYHILESAIIFEAGLEKQFDKIITISSPLELCIERVIQRDKTERQTVLNRINAQMAPEIKIAKSDFIIINDDVHPLIPQLIEIDKTLRALENQNVAK
jgi:dephospho-CoA kinase